MLLLGNMEDTSRIVHVGPLMAWQYVFGNSTAGCKSARRLGSSSCNTFSKRRVGENRRWRVAKKEIRNGDFDLIHIHCASDWSYKRKLSIAKVANAPVIFHIHSGKFDIDTTNLMRDYHVGLPLTVMV